MARPLSTAERVDLKNRLPGALERSRGLIDPAAKELGVDWNTVNRMVEDDEELQAIAASATKRFVDLVKGRLFRAAEGVERLPKEDTVPVLFSLKAVGGMSEMQRVEHGGTVGWAAAPPAPKGEAEPETPAEAAQPILSLIKAPTGTS